MLTSTRPRARDLGIPCEGSPGPRNAITDVSGVEVGYETLIEHDAVRTGVTAVLPLGRGGVGRSCPAGWCSLNGNGEMTGTAWVDETGALAFPIGITNTHAVGPVHRGIVEWVVRAQPELGERWLLPVVARDLGRLPQRDQRAARHAGDDGSGPGRGGRRPAGRGLGRRRHGHELLRLQGGTGTASRRVAVAGRPFTVGVLMQANFGSRRELTIAGRSVGARLADDNPIEDGWRLPAGAGSCITVVATDAPLLPGQCTAPARRVPLGLARTGTTGSHYSGDLFLAFSATNAGALDSGPRAELRSLEFVPWGEIDPLYEAVVQSVEEAVLNVLVAGETMTGRNGHRSPGFPVERLPELLGG